MTPDDPRHVEAVRGSGEDGDLFDLLDPEAS